MNSPIRERYEKVKITKISNLPQCTFKVAVHPNVSLTSIAFFVKREQVYKERQNTLILWTKRGESVEEATRWLVSDRILQGYVPHPQEQLVDDRRCCA